MDSQIDFTLVERIADRPAWACCVRAVSSVSLTADDIGLARDIAGKSHF